MASALQQHRPQGLPARALLANTPFFASDDELCGPSVLAMLLAAAARPADPARLTPQIYLPGRKGTLQAEMLTGARRAGTLAVELPPRLDAVLTEVAAGQPVGVLLNLALSWWPRWHYVVLIGFDLDRGSVTLHSGRQAAVNWSMATFEWTWARSDHWSFVALPPGRLPVTTDLAAVTTALVGMDRAAPAADAAVAWGAAARRWPDDPTLALGTANARLAEGRLDIAGELYAQAGARFDSAVAWNNLAEVRMRQGRWAAAEQAAQLAVARAEAAEPAWLATTRRTLRQARTRAP